MKLIVAAFLLANPRELHRVVDHLLQRSRGAAIVLISVAAAAASDVAAAWACDALLCAAATIL